MTFQYFSENLAYYAPIMLILKPKLQYFSVFLQYFASKISTSTEESAWLEALQGAPPALDTPTFIRVGQTEEVPLGLSLVSNIPILAVCNNRGEHNLEGSCSSFGEAGAKC